MASWKTVSSLATGGRDDADEALRLLSGGRHWYLDRAGPR